MSETNQPQPGDIGVYEQDGLRMEVRFKRKLTQESDCLAQTPLGDQWMEIEEIRWGERLRVEAVRACSDHLALGVKI